MKILQKNGENLEEINLRLLRKIQVFAYLIVTELSPADHWVIPLKKFWTV